MEPPSTAYWFPAKRYGLGWGLPQTWQGWVALAAYVVLMVALGRLWPPWAAPLAFAVGAALLTGGLLVICVAKGEPMRWRWGDRPR